MKKLQVYGDSILKGVTLNEETKKYYINDKINLNALGKEIGVEVVNFSRFGCTVDKGQNILEKNIQNGNTGDYVLVEYGGNDSDFNWADISQNPEKEHFSNTPLELFKEEYNAIVELLKKIGTVPVLTTLIPVDAEKYFSWICRTGLSKENILYWLGDVYAIYRYQEQYSRAVESIAKDTGCECIDLRGAFIRKRKISELFCSDGIHPSVKGQEIIQAELRAFALHKRKQIMTN